MKGIKMEGAIVLAILVAGSILIIHVTSPKEKNISKKEPEPKTQYPDATPRTQIEYQLPFNSQQQNNYARIQQPEQNSTDINTTMDNIQKGFQDLSDKYPKEISQKGNPKRKSNWN